MSTKVSTASKNAARRSARVAAPAAPAAAVAESISRAAVPVENSAKRSCVVDKKAEIDSIVAFLEKKLVEKRDVAKENKRDSILKERVAKHTKKIEDLAAQCKSAKDIDAKKMLGMIKRTRSYLIKAETEIRDRAMERQSGGSPAEAGEDTESEMDE